MLPSVLADRYYGGCEWNGYFLGPAFGPISLGLLGERSFWALGTQNRDLSGLGVCRSSSLVLMFTSQRLLSDAIIEFTDLNSPSRVLWQVTRQPYRMPSTIASGIRDIVATESFMAWTFRPTPNGGGAPIFLYVAGPHGENPHVIKALATGASEFQLTASGDRFVYVEDYRLWTWTVGMAAPERLLAEEGNMVEPWLVGDQLVWIDFRHDGGSAWDANNTEIYWMNLRTRETRRITSDPPVRVAMQINPRVIGDWIVWTDFRNAVRPVSANWSTDRQDIYGYHLPSQREHLLIQGGILREPNLIGDHLYYVHAYPAMNEGEYIEQTCVTSLQSLVQPRDQ